MELICTSYIATCMHDKHKFRITQLFTARVTVYYTTVRKAEQLQDNIDLKLNDVYGVSIESANGRVLVPQNSCLDINPKPNEVYELTKQCEQLKSTWPVNGEQSDPNYSYITMEQNVSVYETIPPIHSQPFRNRYLTS